MRKTPHCYGNSRAIWDFDMELKRAKISLRNIVSLFTNTVSDDLTILRVNRSLPTCVLRRMFCKSDVRRKSTVTLALS